jgi:hypothetical protein
MYSEKRNCLSKKILADIIKLFCSRTTPRAQGVRGWVVVEENYMETKAYVSVLEE